MLLPAVTVDDGAWSVDRSAAGVLANLDEFASGMTLRLAPYLPSARFATNGRL